VTKAKGSVTGWKRKEEQR